MIREYLEKIQKELIDQREETEKENYFFRKYRKKKYKNLLNFWMK